MKLTTKLTAFLLLSTISFSTLVKANDVALPVISKPSALQEGIQRDLTPDQVAELLPWAKDSKIFLVDLLDNTQSLPSSYKLERLVDGMKTVVSESSPKNSELLMRYAINRGLVLNEILSAETSADEVGSIDAKLRVLNASIRMAIKYYDTDMNTLSKKSPAPFVTFGLDYFDFLNELNKSIFDASAQYSIQRTSLEWLQWDLYRDLNNATYASQIVKINNALKFFPTKKMSDAESIALIRQMKKLTSGMDFSFRKKDTSVQTTTNDRNMFSSASDNFSNPDFSFGKKVIASDGYPGVIAGTLGNGDLVIKKESGSGVATKVSEIGFLEGCNKNFCVGDDIIDHSGYKVQITGMRKDGIVYVLGKSWKYSEVRNISTLALTSGCNKDGFCVGDTIMLESNGRTAKITGRKLDNTVMVFGTDWKYSEARGSSQIGKTSGCADRNVCMGDNVFDSAGNDLTVTGILNSKVVYVFGKGWNYSEKRSVENLAVAK